MHDTAHVSPTGALGARLLSIAILAAPAAVLGVVAARHQSLLLLIGAVAEVLGALLFVRHHAAWRPPTSSSVILIYLMSLGWLWFDTRALSDPVTHAARGTLLLAVIALLVCHDMIRTGLEPRRRCQRLCRRLAGRGRWPDTFEAYAELPEVRALQDAARDDVGPVIRLFAHERIEVRLAALTALQGRRVWRPGESAAVIRMAKADKEPAVRAAGVLALRNLADPVVIAAVTPFLRDPAPEVRAATITSLLTGGEDRWPLTRDVIRDALSQNSAAAEAAIGSAAGRLPVMAICDLTQWATESEPLATHAIHALVQHYGVLLRTRDIPELPADLGRQVVDPQMPAQLRVAFAELMGELGFLTPELLDRMTDSDQPGPIRLLAAAAILDRDPANAEAVDVLRGLGRQSNREMALEIARLVQHYVGLDMGLPDGPVATNSKAAAEATRRVLQWASARPNGLVSTPAPLVLETPPATPSPLPPVGRVRPGAPPKPPAADPAGKFKRSSTRFRWLPG